LSLALAGADLWTDSYLSEQAVRHNAGLNPDRKPGVSLPATELPAEHYDLVLFRVPKQLSLLRWQLEILRQQLPDGAIVLVAGMDKHLPRQLATILEDYLGPTERHRGEHKARFFTCRVDKQCVGVEPLYLSYYCDDLHAHIESLPNVFSRDHLDHGSRFMLQEMPDLASVEHVVDLGCGSGVLGLLAATQSPDLLVFIDESALAVASARRNLNTLYGEDALNAQFLQADGLQDYPLGRPQTVLCNPPFHQNHAVNDFVGRRLIRQSARALAPGGELWLVANRHLRYGNTLQREFHRADRAAENSKFILWHAVAAS
jgi:23S rRNA (guanine1835-N2)-methyltransferase